MGVPAIQSGFADIWIKAYANDTANNPFTGNTIVTTGYTQLGFQADEGFSLTFEEDGNTLSSPELQGDVEYECTRRGYMAEVTLDESDFLALQYAASGFTYTAGSVAGTNPDVLQFGTANAPKKFSLLVVDFGADASGDVGALGHYCRKAVLIGGPQRVHNKAGLVKTRLQFRGLVDRDDSVAGAEDLILSHIVTTA